MSLSERKPKLSDTSPRARIPVPCLSLCFVSKTRGSRSRHPSPAIRSSPGWTPYRPWPRFPSRFSSPPPSSNPRSRSRSPVQTARNPYRRGRRLTSGKALLTFSVPPPASPPSRTSLLQRNSASCVKSKPSLSAGPRGCMLVAWGFRELPEAQRWLWGVLRPASGSEPEGHPTRMALGSTQVPGLCN